ncbi:hypothetical protein [Defluviimonas salinarum]|uniref:Uncharacterized protein n=1 Tax=Defluviimonas salinarum TaxID=2992147 RepID=A0ABT3J141_9RHOB|nr:hypothetical protein [Defluviimonas salinarum]MCW3781149.1 hypothetical protein [Defluviimonas salinarum]
MPIRLPCISAVLGLIGLVLAVPAHAQSRESRSPAAAAHIAATRPVSGPEVRSGFAYRATVEWIRPVTSFEGTGFGAPGRIDRRLTALFADELGNTLIKQIRAGAELAVTPAAGQRLDLSVGLNF